MNERGKWDGMLAVARFNWPFYAVATGVLLLGLAGIAAGGFLLIVGCLAVLGCAYFLLGSLGVSHWVYDCSDLYRWSWLDRALGDNRVGKLVLCHSGFDEASEMLKSKFPHAQWLVLDHYDPVTMTEASIQRARKLFPPTVGTVPTRFDQWPVEGASQDVAFALLAIHELRSDAERAAWFAEARRCVSGDGRIVLVEHVRDLANFLAFGPGFMHFHSVGAWRKSWEAVGLKLDDSFRITPFLRVFVLKRS